MFYSTWVRKKNWFLHYILWDFRHMIRDFEPEVCFCQFFFHFIRVFPLFLLDFILLKYNIQREESASHKLRQLEDIFHKVNTCMWPPQRPRYRALLVPQRPILWLYVVLTLKVNHCYDLCHHKGFSPHFSTLFLKNCQSCTFFMHGLLHSILWYCDLPVLLHRGIFALFMYVSFPMIWVHCTTQYWFIQLLRDVQIVSSLWLSSIRMLWKIERLFGVGQT